MSARQMWKILGAKPPPGAEDGIGDKVAEYAGAKTEQRTT